ncbi:MAG: F0F1 ATP synthase subunit B [Clostridia bacterium]|nr:F0F1 ATP synthase subunit B [Clostridia bacterium]
MEDFLAFVTVDKWTMIFTWGNLIILFLLMKKFLFKPVKAVIDAREKAVNEMLDSAAADKKEAESMKNEYAERLVEAKAEAETIVEDAVRSARLKEEDILKGAHKQASVVLQRAEAQIELEKKKALEDVKNDVSDMAVAIASKVIEKDVSAKDHEDMIRKFIDEMDGAE